jgi:hypothetical protein
MKELEIIRYLLDEMESEIKYKEEYEKEKEKAERRADNESKTTDGRYVWYGKYMPIEFDRSPRKSVIKANSMKIRQLMLKMYQ